MSDKPTFRVTNDPFFWVRIEDAGLRYFGGTESECDCIKQVMGDGDVISREGLLQSLRDTGLPINEVSDQFWPTRHQ